LETVEKRLALLESEIAAEEPDPGPMADAIPEPGTPEPEPASAAAVPPPAAQEADRTDAAWKAKTLRGKKRQRANLRRARAVLREKHRSNALRRKDKRKEAKRIRVAVGDPTAPYGLDKLKTYRPLYNVQTMTDVATDLVLAYATVPATADNGLLVPMLERVREVTGGALNTVLADSGYPSGEDLEKCQKLGVTVYAPWKENSNTEQKRAKAWETAQIPKEEFAFEPLNQVYRCPQGKTLTYQGQTKKQRANGAYDTFELYTSDPNDCASCPLLARCVRSRGGCRTVQRQEHQELIDELRSRMATPQGKALYSLRGCTVERRFADSKTHHGLQRFSGRTQERADAQVGLTVLAHNLLTLDKLRHRKQIQEADTLKMAN
jgi:radical SAM protein with 4Fe4S-binding SPASM domain